MDWEHGVKRVLTIQGEEFLRRIGRVDIAKKLDISEDVDEITKAGRGRKHRAAVHKASDEKEERPQMYVARRWSV